MTYACKHAQYCVGFVEKNEIWGGHYNKIIIHHPLFNTEINSCLETNAVYERKETSALSKKQLISIRGLRNWLLSQNLIDEYELSGQKNIEN